MILKQQEIETIRARLKDEKNALTDSDEGSAEDRATVVLDQQSVGRLSRMDALQRQSMAQAAARRRKGRAARIDAALERMDAGEFGYCVECGEEIGLKRFQLDPTLPTCVSCARG